MAQSEGNAGLNVGQKAGVTSTAVTAAATTERVRFTAPSNVVRMQLQVVSETGQILFEVSSKGNVLDWTLQDSSGQRLQGAYLTVVTVKSLSGRVSERIGSVSVAGQQVELRMVETSGNVINAATQYNISGSRVLSVDGTNNIFAGSNAGLSNTTGSDNSFVGRSAGVRNTTGSRNSFFGVSAGFWNTTGSDNSFFGGAAGFWNTTGSANSFFGLNAGVENTTGASNSFFGWKAGVANTTGSNNTIVGFQANVGSVDLTNATAIGANAVASVSDSVVLGSNANVGIGMSTFPNNFSGRLLSVASSARDNGGITVGGIGGSEVLYLYANTTSKYGGIQAKSPGGSFDNLVLQEQGGKVGIGTNDPKATLQVTGGDAAINSQGHGVILRATNGPNCYRLAVDNGGAVTTALVGCP